MRSLPLRNHGTKRVNDLLEFRATCRIARLVEISRMNCAKIDGQRDIPETYRDEYTAIGPVAGLAAHPARLDRVLRPYHQHSGGILECRRNLAVELLTGRVAESHRTDQPCASSAATDGATRALSARAYDMKTSVTY